MASTPIVAREISERISPLRPIAATIAAERCPLIDSTKESAESTPTSIRIKRNNIITAPV